MNEFFFIKKVNKSKRQKRILEKCSQEVCEEWKMFFATNFFVTESLYGWMSQKDLHAGILSVGKAECWVGLGHAGSFLI